MKKLIYAFCVLMITSGSLNAQENKSEELAESSSNPIFELCQCKNSNSFTLDEYGLKLMAENNSSVEEVSATFPNLMKDPESWLLKDFLMDETYISCFSAIQTKQKSETDNKRLEEDGDKIMQAVEQEYPFFYQLLPYLITLAVSK